MDTDEDEQEKNSNGSNLDKTDKENIKNLTKDNDKDKDKDKKNKKSKKGGQPDYKWIITVFLVSFVITILLSMLSNNLLADINLAIALLMLFCFVLLGVVFDMIGMAIAMADEKQFHSMAARKIHSAKCAIKLIRNAERLSSFCNDVIGDIAGILSGATGAAVIASLYANSKYSFAANLIITALIAAFTVGLKAVGKSVAINNSNGIVNVVSKIIGFFQGFSLNLKKEKNEKNGKN